MQAQLAAQQQHQQHQQAMQARPRHTHGGRQPRQGTSSQACLACSLLCTPECGPVRTSPSSLHESQGCACTRPWPAPAPAPVPA